MIDIRLRHRSIPVFLRTGWQVPDAETVVQPFTHNHQPYVVTVEYGDNGWCVCLIHNRNKSVIGTWVSKTVPGQVWKRLRALGPEPPKHWSASIRASS